MDVSAVHLVATAGIAYLLVGVLLCIVHPKLLRKELADLKNADFVSLGFLWKPIMAFVACILFCVLWPIAWFNAGKSERKTKEALDAQLERLRPFFTAYTAMNAPVRYAGGDGSSFDQAVIILDANILSGVRAEYDYIEQRYPGYQDRKQSLKENNGRTFDVIEFKSAEGEDKMMYFDISAYHRHSG
jgi:hypothetical protein